ncbi:MAG: CIA30 family protein [Marinirhabdus sp.]|nr:CIA30 family protein [Marinirhabdus sp.]
MKLAITLVSLFLLNTSHMIFDFNTDSSLKNWQVVDDGVMGGLSQGTFTISEEGHGVFSGTVRLENNGGFSSVRYSFDALNVTPNTKICIRLKGDGKQYQFRVKDDQNTRYSYIMPFDTNGEWETVEISLADMYPSFRGRRLDLPKFDKDNIEELVFLIGNKRKEQFELRIDQIELK